MLSLLHQDAPRAIVSLESMASTHQTPNESARNDNAKRRGDEPCSLFIRAATVIVFASDEGARGHLEKSVPTNWCRNCGIATVVFTCRAYLFDQCSRFR